MAVQTEVVAVYGFETYLEEIFLKYKLLIISFFLFKLSIGNSCSYKKSLKELKMAIKLY